jgi:hypothetical protein
LERRDSIRENEGNMSMNSQMDPKTKQLVEEAESLVDHGNSGLDIEAFDRRFVTRARSMIPELRIAVLEQDKRARHAEEERDAFGKRIDELDESNASLSRHLGGLSTMLAAYGLPSEPKALAGAIERERTANRDRIAELEKPITGDIIRARVALRVDELETKLADAVELAAEAVPCVSDYFREKYEMDERLAKLTPSDPASLEQTPAKP